MSYSAVDPIDFAAIETKIDQLAAYGDVGVYVLSMIFGSLLFVHFGRFMRW